MIKKKVVDKLIKITKKNKPIIIIYSNPNTLISRLKKLFLIKKKEEKEIIILLLSSIKMVVAI